MSESFDRPTSDQFSRTTLDLFDAYVHGAIDRRAFLQKSAAHLGSVAAATAVLAALTPDFARGQVIAPDDKRLATSWVDIDCAPFTSITGCTRTRRHGASIVRNKRPRCGSG